MNHLDHVLKEARKVHPQFREDLTRGVERLFDEQDRASQITSQVDAYCSTFDGARWFLYKWAEWNRGFAGYVARLASECHRIPTDLLVASCRETHPALIASCVFAAAIDEYVEGTHAMYALNFLKAFSGELPYRVEEDTHPMSSKLLRANIGHTRGAYCPSGLGPQAIYIALGVHVASELFAAQEFSVVDSVLRTRFPDRVEVCESAGAYGWVEDHKTLELEHFEHALSAVELAHAAYRPEHDPKSSSVDSVLEGIHLFHSIQSDFFSWVGVTG